jgi:hypothetical protein
MANWPAVEAVGVCIAALAALINAAFFVYYLRLTRGIHRAAVEQARASQKSTDAFVSSERAWVIAELVPICTRFGGNWYRPVAGGHAALSEEEILDGYHLNHLLRLTNMGRTPAHILSYELGYSCLGEGVTSLPEDAVGTQVSQLPFDHVLGAGQSTEAPEQIHVDNYIGSSREEISRSKNTAVFHGWVKYLHVFSDREIVQVPFRYVYRPSLFRLEKAPRPPGEKGTEKEPN